MISTLQTGVRNAKNVGRYIFGEGAICDLEVILSLRRQTAKGIAIFLVDEYFRENSCPLGRLPVESSDELIYISTTDEPTTESIDTIYHKIKTNLQSPPCAIVGIGGGITLDFSKAISNLLTNGGQASDYQGWDLVKKPGIYKIGVPTLSGTGAEATRTCVITNSQNGLKLGMNSDYTVFDQLILDPDLTATVPREQYFFTGMDTYIHCVEALNGSYRNPIGDAFSRQAIELCREVFNDDKMMSDSNRAKLMVASFLGGCAIANSCVGIVHPLSAGLSVVLGLHHCVANCIVMSVMSEFYESEEREFDRMRKSQDILIPKGVCKGLSDDQFHELYNSSIVHEKPLTNALGKRFHQVLTESKVKELFLRM